MTLLRPKGNEERQSTRCSKCEFVQFVPASKCCRRCGAPLRLSTVESVRVTIVAAPVADGPAEIIPMRLLMQKAVTAAVLTTGATTKAAQALGVSHARVKQLLRESGDHTDYRRCRPRTVRRRSR